MTNHQVITLITPFCIYKLILTVFYFQVQILLISVTLFPLSCNSMMFCFFRILGGNSCSILYFIVYIFALFICQLCCLSFFNLLFELPLLHFQLFFPQRPPIVYYLSVQYVSRVHNTAYNIL